MNHNRMVIRTKPFPLYDELHKKTNTDIEPVSNINMIVNLAALSPEHSELVYVLIVHHSILEGHLTNQPYGLSILQSGKGVIINYYSLPATLQKIISQYLASAAGV